MTWPYPPSPPSTEASAFVFADYPPTDFLADALKPLAETALLSGLVWGESGASLGRSPYPA